MAEFTIYKSEAGVRMENIQLKRELDAERAENARLRAICGEPERVLKVAPVRPAAGESFKAGNCTVAILPPANAAISPVVAQARAPRVPVIPAHERAMMGIAGAGAPISKPKQDEEEVDNDDAVLRFSMIELGNSR